jgi:hypothetical protein
MVSKKSEISILHHSSVSRARSEALALSSHFNVFWIPDQVRHDGAATFYESIKIERSPCPVPSIVIPVKAGMTS